MSQSTRCETPLTLEALVDYYAAELGTADEDALEAHLFACAGCAASGARIAAVTETLRSMIPPLLAPDALARLRAKGVRVRESSFRPGERREVIFPDESDLLVHRLEGLDFAHAARVRFELVDESSGVLVTAVDDAPVDREAGAVLVACQRHYDIFPPDLIARVYVIDDTGEESVTEYTVLHRLPGS